METKPIRVPDDVHAQVTTVARLLGCTPGEVLSQAWAQFNTTQAFREQYDLAQKALSVGDIGALVERHRDASRERARRRAKSAAAARD